MIEIPKDIQEGIDLLNSRTGIPISKLLSRLYIIVESNPNIQTMKNDDFKMRCAWAVLYREFATLKLRHHNDDYQLLRIEVLLERIVEILESKLLEK